MNFTDSKIEPEVRTSISAEELNDLLDRDYIVIQWVGGEIGYKLITSAGEIAVSRSATETLEDIKPRFKDAVQSV